MSNPTPAVQTAMQEFSTPLVLEGVRIIDLSTTLAGSLSTHLLAELGADVVRLGSNASPVPGDRSWNRSKRTLADDRTSADGILELIGRADVVVADESSLVAGEPVDMAALERAHPHLIVASVSAYPAGHPDASRPGTELLVLARLGALDEQQGVREGPIFIRYPFASWGAGYLLLGGILVRLWQRKHSGNAQSIQTSLLQGALVPAALYWHRAECPPDWMIAHTLPKRDNPSDFSIFECSDGRWIQILGGFTKTASVRAYLEQIGRPELFGTRVVRSTRPDWAAVFAGRPSDVWLSELWSEDIAGMPVLDPGEVFGLDQSRANGYVADVRDPELGPTLQIGSPIAVDPPASVRHTFASALTPAALKDAWPARTESNGSAASVGLRRGALAGLRVLDFGAYVAGPLAAQCFADHGADVIKIEPIVGEKGRNINQFTGCQRGKRSLAVDLRNPGARDIIRRLIANADVITHNMRSAAASKLGIDDESIRAINPRAVIATSTAYGELGPWSSLPAYDPTALALSGIERMITGATGQPSFLRNSSMDTQTGLVLFSAAMIGLYAREASGIGSKVGTSLLAVAAMASVEAPLVDGTPLPIQQVDPQQMGVSWTCRLYQTADAWIAVDAANDDQATSLLQTLECGRPEDLVDAFRQRTLKEVWAELELAGVPAERVIENARDAFFDREISAGTRLVERMDSSPFGWFENPGGYWSDHAGVIREAVGLPAIGEHNQSILSEVGFDQREIDDLRAGGVIK